MGSTDFCALSRRTLPLAFEVVTIGMHAHFADEKADAQRHSVACPRPHREEMVESEFQRRRPGFSTWTEPQMAWNAQEDVGASLEP